MTERTSDYASGDSDRRPWGAWKVLSVGPGFVVKKIDVAPGGKLSLQSHAHRLESWTIIEGQGRVALDEKFVEVGVGDVISIPVQARHRIENTGSEVLTFIEVQCGDALMESDIVRYEDQYGRS